MYTLPPLEGAPVSHIENLHKTIFIRSPETFKLPDKMATTVIAMDSH